MKGSDSRSNGKQSALSPNSNNDDTIVLKLSDFRARNLPDIGSRFDPQDPALLIKVGEKEELTERMEDAKCSADFDHEFTVSISRQAYSAGLQIEIAVLNLKSNGHSKGTIGLGVLTISECIPRLNKMYELTMLLMHTPKKSPKAIVQIGTIVMAAVLIGQESIINQLATGVVGVRRLSLYNSSSLSSARPGDCLTLRLMNICARDMHNTGTRLDPQDPSIRVKVGSIERSTERVKDAGCNADFPDIIDIELQRSDYDSFKTLIEIEAINIGKLGKKISIGMGVISLKTAVPRMNRPFTVKVPLTHYPKKVHTAFQKGFVDMEVTLIGGESALEGTTNFVKERIEVITNAVAPRTSSSGIGSSRESIVAPLRRTSFDDKEMQPTKSPLVSVGRRGSIITDPSQFNQPLARAGPCNSDCPGPFATIHLSLIRLRDAVDTGTRFDKQDPAVRIKVGYDEVSTDRIQDAGCNADFPESFTIDLAKAEYDRGVEMEIEVANMSSSGSVKSLIGAATVSLKSLVPRVNVATPIVVPLTYQSKSKFIQKGHVELEIFIEYNNQSTGPGIQSILGPMSPYADIQSIRNENTSSMTLYLINFQALDLVDTGMRRFPQAPALRVKVGNVDLITETASTTGCNVSFPDKFEMPLTSEEFEGGLDIEVEVLNVAQANMKMSFTKQIGIGSVSLRSFVPRFNENFQIIVELTHTGPRGQTIKKGVVQMDAFIETEKPLYVEFFELCRSCLNATEEAFTSFFSSCARTRHAFVTAATSSSSEASLASQVENL